MNKKKIIAIILIIIAVAIWRYIAASNVEMPNVIGDTLEDETDTVVLIPESETEISENTYSSSSGKFDYSSVPQFSGEPYVIVNNNVPFTFSEIKNTKKAYERYSALDNLGRCGPAVANVCRDTMPTEKRGEIGEVKPSGWRYNGKSNNKKYDFVDGLYLYNRCHLVGYQLTAENANSRNLITGTRYLNVQGMLPFENMVADYVKETNHHVLYRVTPIFVGNELVVRGVLMEAQSVEDSDIQFCVYCYNIQPGVRINYSTGQNSLK